MNALQLIKGITHNSLLHVTTTLCAMSRFFDLLSQILGVHTWNVQGWNITPNVAALVAMNAISAAGNMRLSQSLKNGPSFSRADSLIGIVR
jgi:hypothetical protein